MNNGRDRVYTTMGPNHIRGASSTQLNAGTEVYTYLLSGATPNVDGVRVDIPIHTERQFVWESLSSMSRLTYPHEPA